MRILCIALLLVSALSISCSESQPGSVTSLPDKTDIFEYTVSISPTPLDRASDRYSNFLIHYRLSPEDEYLVAESSRIESPDWREVYAHFDLSLPEPVDNLVLDYFYTYRLDDNLVTTAPRNTELRKQNKAVDATPSLRFVAHHG